LPSLFTIHGTRMAVPADSARTEEDGQALEHA